MESVSFLLAWGREMRDVSNSISSGKFAKAFSRPLETYQVSLFVQQKHAGSRRRISLRARVGDFFEPSTNSPRIGKAVKSCPVYNFSRQSLNSIKPANRSTSRNYTYYSIRISRPFSRSFFEIRRKTNQNKTGFLELRIRNFQPFIEFFNLFRPSSSQLGPEFEFQPDNMALASILNDQVRRERERLV